MIRWSKVNNSGVTIQSQATVGGSSAPGDAGSQSHDGVVGWRSEADHADGWRFRAAWSRAETDHIRHHTSLLKTMYNLKLTHC